jgi:hypothetical protein
VGMPFERDDVAAPVALELDLVDGVSVKYEATKARTREGGDLVVGSHLGGHGGRGSVRGAVRR